MNAAGRDSCECWSAMKALDLQAPPDADRRERDPREPFQPPREEDPEETPYDPTHDEPIDDPSDAPGRGEPDWRDPRDPETPGHLEVSA